jgi:2-octaprenylphenol hydroxylase
VSQVNAAPDFDIAICGGGMVGATLAGLLLREPALGELRIALIEARLPTHAPHAEIDLRVSAISRASERILARAGAWQALPATQRCAYQQMRVWDAHSQPDSESALQFAASALGEPNLGYIIANNWLQWAALDASRHERITRFAAELLGIELTAECARLSLQDGRRFTARLVIAADGANSSSREHVGIQARVRPYQQSALVTHVRSERSHQHTAWQRFMPNGPIALLPLNDGRSSIVWTTTPEHAAQLLALDEVALSAAISAASDRVLGAVQVTAPRAMFPLQLAQVDEYCRHRFVLVGDAAHSLHPLAGQGVNLGFMDAASLVQVLSEARQAGVSVDALSELPVLRRYERWRKTENTLALGMVDALNRLFSNQQSGTGWLRRTGLRALQQLPLAKRALMLRALGLAGEAPVVVRQPGS